MGDLFPNQAYGRQILKHKTLPVFVTKEFDFFVVLNFEKIFTEKRLALYTREI